jgi:hypothetical protein
MAAYGFLSVGFWVVMVSVIGLVLVFPVGASRGKAAAVAWIRSCMLLFVGGGIAVIVWAVVSGQWQSFMLRFGFSPLAEMMLLAALFVGSMWWMAVQYAAGIKK